MKNSILYLAAVASVAVAQPHGGHGHGHFHQKKGSPVAKRDPDVVTAVVPATATAYMLGDKVVSPEDAQAGIDQGLYIVVGETTPTYTPPAAPSSSSEVDAKFFQKTSSTSSPVAVPTTSSTPAPVTTSSHSAPAATTAAASSSGSGGSGTSGGSGVDREFPSGQIDCSEFPSDYGAVGLSWLETGGWASIQKTPGFSMKIDSLISTIVAGVSGDTCSEGAFCAYSCPDGYIMAQWPEAQGSTGQSVGGLYCNSDGKLELTRSSYKTLCQKGVGGIKVQNKLSEGAAICRTMYPGDEAMVNPTWASAGATVELTNVLSSDYYEWQGKATTLQYYVNNKGLAVEDACVWTSPVLPNGAGNWAAVNIGAGKSSDGITYISIFDNLPTSTAKLDYDIVISGDISGECWLKSGSYPDGSHGCTVGLSDGGSATITLQDSS